MQKTNERLDLNAKHALRGTFECTAVRVRSFVQLRVRCSVFLCFVASQVCNYLRALR
jgi:hypothetical protein